MKQISWKTYLFWILSAEAVGLLAAWLIRDGVEIYKIATEKPAFSPPAAVFPIVWTVLYALMGAGAARVYSASLSSYRDRSLLLYLLQLLLNFLWSIVFFNLQAFGLAFLLILGLWLLIVLMTFSFFKVDKCAALLQLPYIIWVSFAAYLNLGVSLLNR